ncbi:MAG TPA: CHAP domain-containing protein [Candidatus Pelethenecus sp.]|nr:CHAP domain-containing protein [Candidatus Pelethenecus sp.]
MINLLTSDSIAQQQAILNVINKPPAQVIKVELTVDQKIKSNFYKCNTDIEWIRADDATCLPKQVISTPKTEKAVTKPVRASQTYNNDMTPGYCTWHVKNLRPDLPTGLGNANTWYSRANAKGLSVGTTPQVGAVATTTRGTEGHVSYVLQVSNGQILVSEMNVEGWNITSQAWYPSSDYLYIY